MASRIGFTLSVVIVGAALIVGSLGRHRSSPPRPVNDVILISIDTLRADHLGCYGYRAPTSPHIDRFRQDSVLFRQVISACSSTLPAHASMMTSLLPQQHGAEFTRNRALAPGLLTLASIFKARGYRTVSWNDGGEIAEGYGIETGFDVYRSSVPTDRYHFSTNVEAALSWLDTHAVAPQFLFLHTYEVHHPYTPEARYLAMMEPPYTGDLPQDETPMSVLYALKAKRMTIGPRDLQHIVATYDAEIRSMDEAFGRLIEWLQQRGRYDDALIAFTADHGEEFGEHGTIGWHSHTLYDELLRVPLLVKFPGNRAAGATVDTQVRQIDIAPTVVGAVGWVKPSQFRGADLEPLVDGKQGGARFAVSKLDSMPNVSIRLDPWKLYDGQFFDLANDPGETCNVAADHRGLVMLFKRRLAELVAEKPPAAGASAQVSDEEKGRLRALGYLKP